MTDLLSELDAYNSKNTSINGEEKLQDYEKTSLKPYVDHFKRFVAALVKEEMTAAKREREQEEAARAAAARNVPAADAMEF